MKKLLLLGVLCTLSLFACKVEPDPVEEGHSQKQPDLVFFGSFAEETEVVTNPDMGFYRSMKVPLTINGEITLNSDCTKALTGKTDLTPLLSSYGNSGVYSNLVHLMIDLSDYSANAQTLAADFDSWYQTKKNYIENLKSIYDQKKRAYDDCKKNNSDSLTNAENDLKTAAGNLVKEYEGVIADHKNHVASSHDTESLIFGTAQENYNPSSPSNIREVLKSLRHYNKTAIIRFHYDPKASGREYYAYKTGSKLEVESKYFDVEPDFTILIKHIGQICDLLNDYQDVITAVECGMIGPWGEMHGTTYGEGKMSAEEFSQNVPDANKSNITTKDNIVEKAHSLIAMRKFLTAMEAKNIQLPLLVRYPKTLYSYMFAFDSAKQGNISGIPEIYTDEALKIKGFYRLGMYNDGYLGSYSDYGTFKIKNTSKSSSSDELRKKMEQSCRGDEVDFLEPLLRHTAYGGELLNRESKTNKAYWELDNTNTDLQRYNAFQEMEKVHLSYLNISHNKDALSALYNKSYDNMPAFKYILTNMGYRYVASTGQNALTLSGNTLSVRFEFKNFGFAELPYHRVKGYKIYLVPKGSEPTGEEESVGTSNGEFRGNYSSADLTGQERIIETNTVIPLSFQNGEYDVYLKICNIGGKSDGKYAIRFANKGIWNDKLSANKIGSITLER